MSTTATDAKWNGKAASVASEYIARGWAPIPIPPRSKVPIGDKWQELRIRTAAEAAKCFRADANIGVLNGEPSGWLVDVDLDHATARELADDYLPPTGAEFGRASSRRSHRLYVVSGAVETHQRRLPKIDGKAPMIVELRATGSQTVFPGSVHPEGELIDWESDGEPATIAPGLLLAAVDALADEVTKRVAPPHKTAPRNSKPVGAADAVVERARKCLGKLPPAVSGQGGHDQTFHATCVLVHGFALDRGPALELLREWNQTCEPPWSDKELEHKIEDALKQDGERGYLLNGTHTADATQGDKPKIDTSLRDFSIVTPMAWDALQQANVPPALFRFGAVASRIERGDKGEPIIKPLGFDMMRHHLARAATWIDWRKAGDDFIVATMGVKPSPSGESLRFIYWRDGELPDWGSQPL